MKKLRLIIVPFVTIALSGCYHSRVNKAELQQVENIQQILKLNKQYKLSVGIGGDGTVIIPAGNYVPAKYDESGTYFYAENDCEFLMGHKHFSYMTCGFYINHQINTWQVFETNVKVTEPDGQYIEVLGPAGNAVLSIINSVKKPEGVNEKMYLRKKLLNSDEIDYEFISVNIVQ